MLNRLSIPLLILALVSGAGESSAEQAQQASARISVDREHVYVWEPFTITLTVSSAGMRLQLESISDMAGKGQIEMLGENFEELAPKRTVVNRVTHTVRRFRRKARATTTGRIRLAPVVYAQRVVRTRSFFGWSERRTSYPIRAKPLTIEVKPIPEQGRPEDFSGAIGRLSFDVELAPTELAVGDLITATISVEGTGHLDEMKPPAISPGRHFKAYDLKETETGPGKRVFEQVLVPQDSNAVQVAAVSFCFFDTDARQYRTVTRGPFPITFRAPQEKIIDVPYVAPTNVESGATAPKPPPPDVPEPVLPGVERYRALVRALALSLICAIVIGLYLVFKVRRAAVIAGLCIVVGLQGVALFYAVRYGVMARPMRIVEHATSARIAPAPGALVTFEVPKGARVGLHASHGVWRKIELKDKRGWIQAASLRNAH